ncbi:hypothetical protein [Streptomyces sp. R35]|uniref:Pyruvate carboxyltransferase domain-containing protein n=1 Tax=Streptomyces sp. R35 TaxID=3238630 RepID=A0AB39SNE8_9ACTN
MDKPPVFTAEEIARFRAELAARRAPGAHEPGHWSVSPLNRRPDVVGSLPPAVRLRDATLRSVETLPGVVASTVVPLLMVSYLTEETHEELVTVLAGAGATELTLFDGPGAMSPKAYAYLVYRTRTLAPDVEVGLHPHNTFGLAVGCAVAAVRAAPRPSNSR